MSHYKIINGFGDFMHVIKKPFLFCSSYSQLIIIILLLKFNFVNEDYFRVLCQIMYLEV